MPKVEKCELEGLLIVTLDIFGDSRGFFIERFNENKFRELGLPHYFPQDNHSRSAPGVIRGLHFQPNPAQGKLVGAARGSIWDVAVDIRPESPTFGKWFGIELSDSNGKLLWIPPGFAHGFCVTGEGPADVFYKVTSLYNPASETGITYADLEIGIKWPVTNQIVSERDTRQQSFAEYKKNPAVWR